MRSAWPYALVLFLYLATSPYHAGLNNPNEMTRVYASRALAEQGHFVIDDVLRWWGPVDDKATRDGRLYSSKAPLQSMLGVPAYWAYPGDSANEKRGVTRWLRSLSSVAPTFIFVCFLLGWSRRRSEDLSAGSLGHGLGLSLALGTMLYPYALTFTGHGVAAACAGGTFLCLFAMHLGRRTSRERNWLLVAMGFLGGATPFAEYPASLVALPALACALVLWPKPVTVLRLAAGGALPFIAGLWAHAAAWGSPFKTGYSFLENRAYVTVHGSGFFGVSAPKASAFFGSLWSIETGLFFFSPFLAIGLVEIVLSLRDRKRRPLAVAALFAVGLSILFISGHSGWRGGWTLGPRYIIGVVPVLGLFCVEALRRSWARSWLGPLCGISILLTGFAAALYPHLSDVYSNPLRSFLLPSYLRGASSYGLAHDMGLTGHWQNAVHSVPLVAAVLYAGTRGSSDLRVRAFRFLGVLMLTLGIVWVVPESHPARAAAENERLWGFWEPQLPADRRWSVADHLADVRVAVDGHPHSLRGERIQYGPQPWQHVSAQTQWIGGIQSPMLHVHPIQGQTLRVDVPVAEGTSSAEIVIGLTDASVASDNPEPVALQILVDDVSVFTTELSPDKPSVRRTVETGPTAERFGFELETARDGARVMGFGIRFAEPERP